MTDELREQGRRGLTGAEFVLLMLGYDCDCVCHIAGQWAHCYDCDPPTLEDEAA